MTVKYDNTTIDGFRFIDNLQTTVRQLRVFSAIIFQLNNKQLPKKILEQLLSNWSLLEEKENPVYNNGKGKITNNGIKTAALGYYLQISNSLGLTTRFNDVYMNTKMSQTFLYFLLNNNSKVVTAISLGEKAFYLYQLFTNDADGIILVLSQLINCKKQKQTFLQKQFKEAINARLASKMELAPSIVKSQISLKYRTINFIWKSPEKYAEHIIAPRYEWLSDLGLVHIERENRDTLYSISEQGIKLYDTFPDFGADNVKDITQNWIYKSFFNVLNEIFNGGVGNKYFNLSVESQNTELGKSLEKAAKAVKSSISFKLPIAEVYFFVCLDLFLNKNIVIDFENIEDKLKSEFSYNSRIYLLKLAGRPNEGYITITLKK